MYVITATMLKGGGNALSGVNPAAGTLGASGPIPGAPKFFLAMLELTLYGVGDGG
jgi:hypothetical protein